MPEGFKPSYYNFLFDLEDGTHLAFNGMTGAFVKIGDEQFLRVKEMLADPVGFQAQSDSDKALFDSARRAQFVIADDYDEIAVLKFRANKIKYSSETFYLTIMPTLDCNFRCAYCYENFKKGKMKPEAQKVLLEWVDERLKSARVFNVAWFGGEPLMALNVMRSLTAEFKKICKRRRASYVPGITTNGYFMIPKVIREFKDLGIKVVQLTIDGPPETHDKRRVLADGRPTFHKIMKNLVSLCEMMPKIEVKIRVNYDPDSFDRIPELFPMIPDVVCSKSEIYFRQAFPAPKWWDKNAPSKKTSVERGTVQLNYMDLQKKAQEHGFKVFVSNYSPQAGYCEADYANHFVIDPDCNIHKCTVAFDEEHKIGHIDSDGKVRINVPLMAKWIVRDVTARDICRKCKILPLCMGGCGFSTLCSINKDICSTVNNEKMTIDNLTMLYNNMMIDLRRKQGKKKKLKIKKRSRSKKNAERQKTYAIS